MYIHQEKNDMARERYINSDMITYIDAKHNDTTVYYECYIVGDEYPLTITEETLEKILIEKGWV